MLTSFPYTYAYVQYNDSPGVVAFVEAQNNFASAYLSFFNGLNLPIYTNDPISGDLLDFVLTGLYGIVRPSLSTPVNANWIGAYNTFSYNVQAYNQYKNLNPSTQSPVDDDIYRRVATWTFYKGDGQYFSTRWLKRRVMRFLYGPNGVDPGVSQTYPVSVVFAGPWTVVIRFAAGTRTLTSGSIYNAMAYNQRAFNSWASTYTPNPYYLPPNTEVLQEAIKTGVLPLPFQYTFIVQTS